MYIETIEDFSDAEGLVGIDWAVENLISVYNPTIIYGPGGSYKSTLALHLAICLQNGLPFHNKKTSKGNVLYICLEGIYDIAPRYAAYKQEHGEPESMPKFTSGPFVFGNQAHFEQLTEILWKNEEEIEYLIIDTLSLAVEGDINTGNTPPMVTRELRSFCDQWECTPIVIAHTGKDKGRGIKGASEFFNNVATVLSIDNQKIKVEKQRSGKKGETLAFDIIEKEILENGDTSICIRWKEYEEKFQSQVSEKITELLKEHDEGLTNQDLFTNVYQSFENTKTRENVRTQFNRAKKTLKKTFLIEEIEVSESKKDNLIRIPKKVSF